MRWSTESKVNLGLGSALAVLIVMGGVSYQSTVTLTEAERSVGHTHEVLEKLEDVLADLAIAETAQRGYLITGKESYLEPYYIKIKEIDHVLEDLQQLTVDDPEQGRRLDILEPLVLARFVKLKETIEVRKNQGFESALQVVQSGQGKQIMDKIQKLIREMLSEERELLKQRKQQTEATAYKTTLVVSSGSLLGFGFVSLASLIIKRDITKRQQVEEALQQAQSRLEVRVEERTAELKKANELLSNQEAEIRNALEKEKELSELKSRFVTMTSHEYRTPLATILSSTELLEHYSHKWGEERKLVHLQRIQTAVKAMTQLLNDVLLIGKAEAGKLEFSPTPLELAQFCRNLVQEIQITTSSHSIAFCSQGQCQNAVMDEKLLRHVLSNLLSNAIKYSPQGGTVHFDLTCNLAEATFQVRDEGIGIPEADQAQLFNSFHRASNVGTISGTGLGLAIVKKSLDLHGGNIAVKTELGAGTTFTVRLPLNKQV